MIPPIDKVESELKFQFFDIQQDRTETCLNKTLLSKEFRVGAGVFYRGTCFSIRGDNPPVAYNYPPVAGVRSLKKNTLNINFHGVRHN